MSDNLQKKVPATNQPNKLPELPIWNNDEVCDRCYYWWRQSSTSQDQDHCRPMYDTNEVCERLTPDQKEEVRQIAASGIRCPCFVQLTAANYDSAAEYWSSDTQKLIKTLAESAVMPASFVMLRYETEFTPCTGITAVSKQERRHFPSGVTVAPWCPRMKSTGEALSAGKVAAVGSFRVEHLRKECRVYQAQDGLGPLFLLGVEGHFLGVETPYDTPDLKRDSLVFALAVEMFLRGRELHPKFVWCADWETVPALLRLRSEYKTVLTLHNTFDECLTEEARDYADNFPALLEENEEERRIFGKYKTALEVGMRTADVVTTVNRGFAVGIRREVIQKDVMARHLQHLAPRIIGVDNGSFAPLGDEHRKLLHLLRTDFAAGEKLLFETKAKALVSLPEEAKELREKAPRKVVIVSMGRLVSQKMHDVFVEALRGMLAADPGFPILAVFAVVGGGDADSDKRYARIQKLREEFPKNVICSDRRIPYYRELMAAADYNCMPSLYEPHGGAFEGTVLPIARAIDGLAEQICPFEPSGAVTQIASPWHPTDELSSGFLFRENIDSPAPDDIKALLTENPPPFNEVFQSMVEGLTLDLKRGVEMRLHEPERYARLVMAALAKQERDGWNENLKAVIGLL